MERGHSQRQACELIELPRSILQYCSLRTERDTPALDAMRRIAATYPRYGYRRVRIFLRREGHAIGPERASSWPSKTGTNQAVVSLNPSKREFKAGSIK